MTASIETEIEAPVLAGAINALRRRAKYQADRAAENQTPAGEKFPNVMVGTGESAVAARLSATLGSIADELEREGLR